MTSEAERVEGLDAGTFWQRRDEFEGCELVEGKVRRVSPTGCQHGQVEARLAHLLTESCQRAGRGEVVVGEVGYQLGERHVRAADVAVHLSPPASEPGWMKQMPDVAVEVVSPSDRWTDVERKAADYLRAGVREVWIADPMQRRLLVRWPDGTQRTYGAEDVLRSEVLSDLAFDVGRVFR